MRIQTPLNLVACLVAGFSLCFSPGAMGYGGVIKDVELSSRGILKGRVIHPNGTAVSQAAVQVRYRGKTIAVASSSANGQFAVEQVRGGLHEVVVAGQSTPVRFWTSGAAPIGCPPELFSEVASPVGQFCPAAEGCGVGQTCQPVQQCVLPESRQLDMVDVFTLATLGTSIAALVIAIDANNAAKDAVSAGTGTGGTAALSSGDSTTGGIASP